jgi:hypothetical protein
MNALVRSRSDGGTRVTVVLSSVGPQLVEDQPGVGDVRDHRIAVEALAAIACVMIDAVGVTISNRRSIVQEVFEG